MNQKMLVGEVWVGITVDGVGSGVDDDDMIDLSCKMMKKVTICQLNDLTEDEYFSCDVGH